MDAFLRDQGPERNELGLPILSPAQRQAMPSMPEDILSPDSFDPMAFFKLMGLNPSTPTPGKGRKQATEMSRDVLANWNRLHQILERHEEVVRKRWLKKTKAQRKSLLLKISPEMPLFHRPDYEALGKEGPQLAIKGTKFRSSYL